MNDNREREYLNLLLKETDISVCDEHKQLLYNYAGMLKHGLKKQRLSGEKTIEGILNKLIVDSLYVMQFHTFNNGLKVIDLGTGAGIPGIPLKICLPEIHLSLLDSNQRKMKFLKETVTKLKLNYIDYLCGRAEEWGQNSEQREKYDCLVTKAVGSAAVLAELALPLIKVGGTLLLYKGPKGDEEIMKAARAIEICGGAVASRWPYRLSGGEKRILFKINKIKETPLTYPRSSGKPEKNPIV